MTYQKKTKIVATIGPSSESKTVLKQMIAAGMNIARLNFSHGSYENHAALIQNIRKAAKETGRTIGLLQDIQGPRIRTGLIPDAGISITEKQRIALVSQAEYDKSMHAGGYAHDKTALVPIGWEQLYKFVHPKGAIFIQDGLIELRVLRVERKRIHCVVVQGGVIHSHKGMNAPGAVLKTPVITPKDKKDIAFGVAQGVDYIALSFVQTAAHIRQLRALLPKKSQIKIIAKIEQQQAIDNFDSILKEVDGIMVARGDLGVELGSAEVPILQKELVKRSIAAGKPVIVATQMLESMIVSPRPTRAEAADVANAVIDHADALMLSAESATGQFPVKTIQTMSDIIARVEESNWDDMPEPELDDTQLTAAHSIAHAAVRVAKTTQAKAIVVLSASGQTVRFVSQLRPEFTQVIALHSDEQSLRQYQLIWGVEAMALEKFDGVNYRDDVTALLKKERVVKKGDVVVIAIGFHVRNKAAVVEVVEIE
jgi:pyruvate kinase